MFRNQSKRFWATLIACVALFVFYFPSLVAFRYTAPPDNVSFLYMPWRSWSFAWTALTVPGDAKLKTSGEALREAERTWRGAQIGVDQVRVLFLSKDEPYTFTHDVAGRSVSTTITPTWSFVWQVRGHVGKSGDEIVIGLLDYRTAAVLYDIRNDVPAANGPPATPFGSPSASPSVSASATP